MSSSPHRPHPLRQTQTIDVSISGAVARQLSTTSSSASSGYTNTSDHSVHSSSTSATSVHGLRFSHKRGQSDVLARARTFEVGEMGRPQEPDRLYTTARQSLRPLPQAPVAHLPPAPKTPPHPSLRHERGKSVDAGKLPSSNPQLDGPASPGSPSRKLPLRPNSMLLSRSDSVNPKSHHGVSQTHTTQHVHTTHIGRSDLEDLGRSSTSQLRALSRFAKSDSADEIAMASQTQEVVGLKGRRRLQRTDKTSSGRKDGGYGWEGRNWMDKQRQFLQAYEYLCHIGEAKEWVEDITQKNLPPIIELEEALRNGVTLAEVVEVLNPDKSYRIFHHPKLQYRHSDNIAIFFRYLDEVELPDLFRFELIDLYEKKNIPKVIYCIHALSWLLFRKGIVDFRIGNLVGQLEFEHHELEAVQKGLDKLGVPMPSFGNMGADFGMPEPEPEETEEERVDRELAENLETIVDLQAQARGALLRVRLGETMQQLWDQEELFIDIQSRIRGDFARQIVGYRMQMRRFAVQLQSHAKGFLIRRGLEKSDKYWKAIEPDVLELQSLIRARKSRKRMHELRSELARYGNPVRDVQALARAFMARRRHLDQQREWTQSSDNLTKLQAAIRGTLRRQELKDDGHRLQRQSAKIISIQAAARAALVRTQIVQKQDDLQSFSPAFTALQAAIRGKLTRLHHQTLKANLKTNSQELALLQAVARAAAVRIGIAKTLQQLEDNSASVTDVQRTARGMMERRRISSDRQRLDAQGETITRLQGCVRGSLARRQHERLLADLHSCSAEIAAFQGFLRALVVRGRIGDLLADLEEEERSIVAFQAVARGFIVRARFEEKKRFFNEHMQKVVKIQSFVRAKVQGEAYKSLTTGKNPPVNAVKNFVHLLNDSDFDFNEEVEFERMRKTVVQQVRQNELVEQYIDQLDIKIALLVKNKITLDEFVRQQHSSGGHSISLLANASLNSGNQFDLKALNKSSRKKLESYQQLFFNLQTQPQYLARLFRRIREQGTAEKECKRVELLMMSLFGYAQKRREEYYLLKLLARAIREEIQGSGSLQDYTRGNYFWQKLLNNYSRSPRDRKYLRDLLGPLIRDHIIEDPALDLESDPMQIYRYAINNERLRTGRPDHRPLDVSREVAIRDPETRRLFVDHLRDLREICDQLFLAMEDLLHKMPYGLRFLSGQMYEALCQHFTRESQDHLLQVVANWLWKFYLQPALTNPENVGVMEKSLNPLQRRNLGEVAKVVGQIASGRPFGGENIYLQPLNAFVAESIERLAHITVNLIAVPNAEKTFDIDEFNDLYAKNKPTLYIKLTDVFAVHTLVAQEQQYIAPSRDDVLREIMQDLGSAKSNESEMNAAGTSEVHMSLTPKLHDVEDPEAEVKALFMETKRCVLYIIRVQTGANLLEILVKPITSEDEHKWQSLLRGEFAAGSNTRGAYSDTNMVDVTRMSYYNLKRTALENVMRLEKLGRISKHNFYQDVLNAIASDIRTKSRRRVQRQREIEGVRLTLGNLHEKAKYLEQQRKSYDDYIEHSMTTLQNKKGKKKFILPFTKQYNHQRELERNGKVPKYGSYKYSARDLFEKGVLVSWGAMGDRDWDKMNIIISCDEVGVFLVEGSRGSIQIPGASSLVPIEDLLQAQFEAHQFMHLFEGALKLNVNLLRNFLYKKFY